MTHQENPSPGDRYSSTVWIVCRLQILGPITNSRGNIAQFNDPPEHPHQLEDRIWADAKAAEYLGSEVVAQALEKLKTTGYTGISFTHPPMSRRIKKLQMRSSISQRPG